MKNKCLLLILLVVGSSILASENVSKQSNSILVQSSSPYVVDGTVEGPMDGALYVGALVNLEVADHLAFVRHEEPVLIETSKHSLKGKTVYMNVDGNFPEGQYPVTINVNDPKHVLKFGMKVKVRFIELVPNKRGAVDAATSGPRH